MLDLYEIHITTGNEYASRFKELCASISVKPILLLLQTRSEERLNDLMTSSVVKGYSNAVREISRISKTMRENGLPVKRVKVEVPPNHQAAEDFRPEENRKGQYFESHLELVLDGGFSESQLKDLHRFFRSEFNLHMSINVNKLNSGSPVYMATFRSDEVTSSEFISHVEDLYSIITGFGIDILSKDVEFVLFDSNKAHDDAWTGVSKG